MLFRETKSLSSFQDAGGPDAYPIGISDDGFRDKFRSRMLTEGFLVRHGTTANRLQIACMAGYRVSLKISQAASLLALSD
jgi:hypothetical protein